MRSLFHLFSISCLAVALAWAQPLTVTEHTLSNGMQVLVHEDHDIPNVALQFFFRVGSRNERPGITGISHFFEHMMFNGAKKYGPKQFDIVMEKNGGSNNAYTTQDVTVYTDWLPRSALELVMEMEADRIENLSFDPTMIESERGVVSSERRSSVENDNFELLLEQLYAAAYTAHPYRWPVIGWASDIQSWTLADLENHFRMGYSPSNCVAVAVGDVSDMEIMALARKYLEAIPSHDPPPPVVVREPEQLADRRVVVRRAAQVPLKLFAYHVPASDHVDYWPLQVMGTVLADGRSSRLYRRLVDRSKRALYVSYWQRLSLDPGLLIFSLELKGGVDLEQAERAFLEELDRLQSGGISTRDLKKAKNMLLTGHLRELRTNSGKADLLGQYEIFFGGFRELFSMPQKLERVTTADVRRVAKRYLQAANRTVATLIPEAQEHREAIP